MNQIAPSEETTTSLGLLRRLPSKLSARVVTDPSCSVRVTLRSPCWALTRRPWRSTVLPLE